MARTIVDLFGRMHASAHAERGKVERLVRAKAPTRAPHLRTAQLKVYGRARADHAHHV
jgi:hypothetical protein